MSLLGLIIALVLIGALLLAINKWIPMDPKIQRILNVVVVFVVILWLLYVFGLIDELRTIKVPRL